jgi:hypothetical protein
MEERLIFFVDFLGFAEAVSSWDDAKLTNLIELLSDLRSLQGDFESNEETTDDGRRFTIRPAISTFSDHIVISYPTRDLLAANNDFGSGLISAEKLISPLAAAAMRLGLLIRGGATIGPLHHKDGVVVGGAMIEAYRLESGVSVYPRIAVSQNLYSKVNGGFGSLFLQKDYDGITHFNYFGSMIARSATPDESVASWVANTRKTVAHNIESFEGKDWSKMAKWVWFGKHLEEAYSTYPDGFFV